MIILSLISDTALESSRKTISFFKSEKFEATEFHINYPLKKFQPKSSLKVDHFPLTISGYIENIPIELRIFPISIVYNGSEPISLINVLKTAGFTFNEDIILSKKYSKNKKIVLSGIKN